MATSSDTPGEKPALIDSHAHLELEPLASDVARVVERAWAAGLRAIITVGIDLEDAKAALRIAESFDRIFVVLGFHPHNAAQVAERGLAEMEQLAGHPKVRGYGEIGLDFFRNRSPHDVQRRVFREQLELAKSLSKPVVIHLRDAYDEGIAMLEDAAPFPCGGVVHCFSGDADHARRVMDLGFHLSIPGTVTYKKNDALRAIVADTPTDRLLLETDCPFLAPEPKRGKDNEPAHIVYTAKAVARARNCPVTEIGEQTSANAIRLFDLDLEKR